MTDVIKPTSLSSQTDGATKSQEPPEGAADLPSGGFRDLLRQEEVSAAGLRPVMQQQEPSAAGLLAAEHQQEPSAAGLRAAEQQQETAVADFRHLLQNQASAVPNGPPGLATPPHENLRQEMPDLTLHDGSLKIGRVIFTGNSNGGQDSQLTQFMRDHGFSEGGMAGYMKQTMLGAGSAIAQAVGDAHIDVADAVQAATQALADGAIRTPAQPALHVAQILSETTDAPSTLNTMVSSTVQPLPLPEAKLAAPAPLDTQAPMRTEAVMDEVLLPASTKDILSAQWPQVHDDQKQIAAAQTAERDSGAADVDFANQQQSGQRSGQGEQSGAFTQTHSTNNDEAQTKAQQYREWSERFSELLGTRLAVAVREGSWSVQLDLDAMDLGSVAIQLNAGAEGIEGQVTSSDPAVRQILADSLPKLQAALAEALGDSVNQAVVSLSLGPIQNTSSDDFKTIALSADELSKALPADFKAGDGLNVFV